MTWTSHFILSTFTVLQTVCFLKLVKNRTIRYIYQYFIPSPLGDGGIYYLLRPNV